MPTLFSFPLGIMTSAYLFEGSTNSTSYTLYDLTPNTNYGFVVIAKAGSKESEYSNMKKITTPVE